VDKGLNTSKCGCASFKWVTNSNQCAILKRYFSFSRIRQWKHEDGLVVRATQPSIENNFGVKISRTPSAQLRDSLGWIYFQLGKFAGRLEWGGITSTGSYPFLGKPIQGTLPYCPCQKFVLTAG